METAVSQLRYEVSWRKRDDKHWNLEQQLVDTVLLLWDQRSSNSAVSSLYETLIRNYANILECNGDNTYKVRDSTRNPSVEQLREILKRSREDNVYVKIERYLRLISNQTCFLGINS